jgi:excisionase family DNA binding protein
VLDEALLHTIQKATRALDAAVRRSIAVDDKILASTATAERALDASGPTIRRWIREGKLRAVTVPGTEIVRIPVEELHRFAREEVRPVTGPIRPRRERNAS